MAEPRQTYIAKFDFLQAPIICAVGALLFSIPLLLNWQWIGKGDWELFVMMADIPRYTILEYGQFPFWNMYLGGGNILFHHPEVGILSPTFLLILVFGAAAGIKAKMVLAYFLGFYGAYLLARKLGMSKLSAYLVSFGYFGSSYFALHFAIGHVPFTHFCYLPWFIYFILKSYNNWKYIFGASISIALIILGNGAAIPFLYTAFFSGIMVLLYAFDDKNYRLIKKYIVAIVSGVALASVKFIPMYVYLSQNKWEGQATDATPLGFLFKAFFSFEQGLFDTVKTADHWGWHEYSAYISPLLVILAVVALIYRFKKYRPWFILAVFFFIFGLGHFSDFSPWAIFSKLPGFESIRAPARAFQFVIFPVAILAGFGLDIVRDRWKLNAGAIKYIPLAVVLIVTATNICVNYPALATVNHKYPSREYYDQEFKHIVGNKFDIYKNFKLNRGSLMAPWLSAYKESRGIVMPNNQVMMEYITQGEVKMIGRKYTPNRVEYVIDAKTPGQIVFGIGYDDGWQADEGRELSENQGLVSTRFDAGQTEIVLKYMPPWFIAGFVVTKLMAIIILLIFSNPKIGKRFKPVFD